MARITRLAVAVAAVVATGGFAPTAQAVFPGANGRIAFGIASSPPCGDCSVSMSIWTASRGARASEIASGLQPAFSPDGRRLAFVGERGVEVARADGSRRRALGRGYHSDSDVAWSPRGDKLAFIRRDGGKLLVVGARGGSPRRLFLFSAPTGWGVDLAWSPSGSELALATYGSSGQGASIRRIALDGSSREIGSGWHMSWSAAGWLAYERADGLYLARPDSAGERLFAPLGPRGVSGAPDDYPRQYSWSPEGKRIAFGTGGRIYVARAAGGEARAITSRGACCPQWSPDGRQVAFVKGLGVFVVPARGGRTRLFTRARGLGCFVCEHWVTGLDWRARPRDR
jgi:dipeptidyl aminopeptidase/acylaminoacyl peptidase